MSKRIWISLYLLLFQSGCGVVRLPRLPEPIQDVIVPQALSWQHKDITRIRLDSKDRTSFDGTAEERFLQVLQKLDGLKYSPRSISAIKATLISAATEGELARKAKDQDPKTASHWGRLSKSLGFQWISIPGADGFVQSGVLAGIDRGKPSVILLPGTFDGADALYIRDLAVLCRRHGFNVLVLESRNHGRTLETWTTLGWKESGDIIAAAEWLRESSGGSSVAVIGFSLGAWYAIRAGYEASILAKQDLFQGGIIAFSPPIGIREAIRDWDRPEFRGKELTIRNSVFAQFDAYLRRRVDKAGLTREFKRTGGTFDAYMELAARANGLQGREELYRLASVSPEDIAARLRAPLVVFHAKDDPVVRVKHSLDLARALKATPSPYVRVIVKKKGGHAALQELDPVYFVKLVFTVLDGLKQEGESL